jgi:hypothetical protein
LLLIQANEIRSNVFVEREPFLPRPTESCPRTLLQSD